MLAFTAIPFAVILPLAVGHITTSVPGCALRCWENTKYVSQCVDEACFCSEATYQNSVYQCLYSQCDSAHFGPALHHTISQCTETSHNLLLLVPPILNRELLRKREEEYVAGKKLYGSVPWNEYSVGDGFATQSTKYPTQSISYLTRSTGGLNSPTVTAPPVPYAALESPSLAITSANPAGPTFDVWAVSPSNEPQPQLFTGTATVFGVDPIKYVLLLLMGVYSLL